MTTAATAPLVDNSTRIDGILLRMLRIGTIEGRRIKVNDGVMQEPNCPTRHRATTTQQTEAIEVNSRVQMIQRLPMELVSANAGKAPINHQM